MNQEKTIDRMRRKLTENFTPSLLEIEDESARHAGHAGAPAGADGETHFRVSMVSEKFTGLAKVARHRLVYAALGEDMREGGIHALALHLAAPREI